MTSLEKVHAIAGILDSKKASDIRAVKVRDLTVIADYFIFASGSSSTQIKALADEVEVRMTESGEPPLRRSGLHTSGWVVLDYGDVICHIFYRDTRSFYDLDRLWADGEPVSLDTDETK